MSRIKFDKEIISKKNNNYLVKFYIDEHYITVSVNEYHLNDETEQIHLESISLNEDVGINSIIGKIKDIIEKHENPSKLVTDLMKWDGHIKYDITQEERDETLQYMLELMLDGIDDAGGFSDDRYSHLLEQLDKFRGVR